MPHSCRKATPTMRFILPLQVLLVKDCKTLDLILISNMLWMQLVCPTLRNWP